MKLVDQLRRIARVLKERFPNLSMDETLEIAAKIMDELDALDGEL